MDITTPLENRVILYGWDLKGFPKPFLKSWTKISKLRESDFPEQLIHVGIAVYKQFYHFNHKGCQITKEIPLKRIELFPQVFTKKTQSEFDIWLEKSKLKFSSGSYHPISNNCIDFAKEACDFLDVSFPTGLHTKLNSWLKDSKLVATLFKSEKMLTFFGFRFGTSSRTYIDGIGEEDKNEDELIGWEALQ